MKIKPGKTYWAANGRALYCDHRYPDGTYRMIDLGSQRPFLANSRGYPLYLPDGFRAVTRLHYKMALEIVQRLHLSV